jgi:hypothetical protein
LPTEWEVVYIATLMSLGDVAHEPPLENGTARLDIVFHGPGERAFAAEVVAPSDDSADQQNPVEGFFFQLGQEHAKLAGRTGGLRVDVASARSPTHRRRLALPPKDKIPNVIRLQVRPFFREVAKTPTETRTERFVDDTADYDFTLRSVPGTAINHLNHEVYTTPGHKQKNVLYNNLKDKARQLAASAWSGVRGIVVCDGDCEALHESSARRVIGEFFRGHRSVHFVQVLEVDRGYRAKVLPQLYWNPYQPVPAQVALDDLLQKVVQALPPPVRSPTNAHHMLGRPKPEDGSFYGGYTLIGDKKVKLSARTVLRLLSGDLKYEDFRQAHSAPLHGDLLDQLRSGRRIETVEVEHLPDSDDDWLVLTFGERDAAYGEFADGDRDAST